MTGGSSFLRVPSERITPRLVVMVGEGHASLAAVLLAAANA